MLRDLQIATADNDEICNDLRQTANYLMARQFLHIEDRNSVRHYNRIVSDRYFLYFQNLFDALGFTLVREPSEGWLGLLPDPGAGFSSMYMDETIFLLILALIWQESVNAGEVEEHAVVLSDSGAMFDRYQAITGRTRITQTRAKEILSAFKRRALIRLGDIDPDTLDVEIWIRPIVRRLVGENVISALEQFAATVTEDDGSAAAENERGTDAEDDTDD